MGHLDHKKVQKNAIYVQGALNPPLMVGLTLLSCGSSILLEYKVQECAKYVHQKVQKWILEGAKMNDLGGPMSIKQDK